MNKNEKCANCGDTIDLELTEVTVTDTGVIMDIWLCGNCRERDYGDVNNDDDLEEEQNEL